MKDFFRKVCSWIVEHKKTVIAVCVVVCVIIVITACSSFGDVQNAQFGLQNTVTGGNSNG